MPLLTHQRLPYVKACLHVLALAPLVYLAVAVSCGELGGDPVQRIIHFLGKGALNLLVLTLCISPLAKRYREGLLIATRRLIGLYCFFYASLHVLAFIWLDLGLDIELLVQELAERPYIWIGASAFIILLLLAITSPQLIRKKMRRNWQKLHNFIYLAAVSAPIHYYWSVKSGWLEPLIYAFILAALLLLRNNVLLPLRKK